MNRFLFTARANIFRLVLVVVALTAQISVAQSDTQNGSSTQRGSNTQSANPQLGSSRSGLIIQNGSAEILVPSALVSIAQSVEIPIERSGVLIEVVVKPGQIVEKGQLIAKVKDESLLLRLERVRFEHELAKMAASSNVDVEYSKKSFDVAVSDLRRSTAANSRVQNSVPPAKLEKLQLERDRTELQLRKAKRDLEMAAFRTQLTSNEISLAKSDLSKATITSPMSGMVVSVEKREGEWVESSDLICKVVRTDRLQIEGFVSAENSRRIRIGSQAKIVFPQRWVVPNEIPCEIVFVSPEVNPINSKLMVRAEFDNRTAKVPAGLQADIVVEIPR